MNWWNLIKFLHMRWPLPHLGWDCYMLIFAILQQSYGLWLLLEFRFSQYLQNELMEIDEILHMYWLWPGLIWDCNPSFFFANLQHGYSLWLLSKFRFRSIVCGWIDGIWSNFAYTLTLPSSRLGVLFINFCSFTTELCPWLLLKFCFRSVSCEKLQGTFPDFVYRIIPKYWDTRRIREIIFMTQRIGTYQKSTKIDKIICNSSATATTKNKKQKKKNQKKKKKNQKKNL